jgi:Immunity protein 8
VKNNLILRSISSAEIEIKKWYPLSNEDVFICLDLEIEFSENVGGANLFYVTLATPESLRIHRKGPILVKNRTLVVSEYNYDVLRSGILEILECCSRESWSESCIALQRYFQWEYEDYSMES